MSAEMLARLAPKIVDLGSLGAGHGDLQPLDLAAALAGLAPGPYFLARVAWVDDRAGWRELTGLVLARLRVGPEWEGVIALAGPRSIAGRRAVANAPDGGKSRNRSTTGCVRLAAARAMGVSL